MKNTSISNSLYNGKPLAAFINKFLENPCEEQNKVISFQICDALLAFIETELLKENNEKKSQYFSEVILKFLKLLEWIGIDPKKIISGRSELIRIATIFDLIFDKWKFFRNEKREQQNKKPLVIVKKEALPEKKETVESYLKKNGLKVIGTA